MKPDAKQETQLKNPVQKRSRATLERIYAATESLLRTKRFSEISIAEIAAQAGCGVGTIYGRFDNKNALLATLEKRVMQNIADRLDSFLSARDWSGVGFEKRAIALTDHIAEGYRIHGPILRELVGLVHQQAGGASDESRSKVNAVFRRDVDFLMAGLGSSNRVRARKTIGLALISLIVTLQNRLLQIETSPIEQQFSDSFLKSELPKMMIAYVRSVFRPTEKLL